jgi:hypothetical protein
MIALSTLQESRRYDDPANPAGHAQLHHAQGHDQLRTRLDEEHEQQAVHVAQALGRETIGV